MDETEETMILAHGMAQRISDEVFDGEPTEACVMAMIGLLAAALNDAKNPDAAYHEACLSLRDFMDKPVAHLVHGNNA